MVKFTPSTDIPSLANKTILVTGGNIGLGRETIFQLAQHQPGHIWLAARSKEKALATIEDIKRDLAGAATTTSTNDVPITFVPLDLQSFDSIKAAVRTVTAGPDARLDILINNAGIMMAPPGQTQEGYEAQFGTNHMGHALLTRLLLPTLLKTAQSSDVRIVFVSSMAERNAPGTAWTLEAIKTPDAGGLSSWARYSQSKLANVHYARALAQRYPSILCVSLHPGAVHTNITNGIGSSFPLLKTPMTLLSRVLLTDVAKGAVNQLWAATAPRDQVISGTFYCPVGVTGKDSARARDDKLTQELWEWTEKELEPYL